MIERSEAHFDGPFGWVDLKMKPDAAIDDDRPRARFTSNEATRDHPDLHFWGEGDCPLEVFETAPDVGELRVWIEGPIEGDTRTCWSVGIWLRDRTSG